MIKVKLKYKFQSFLYSALAAFKIQLGGQLAFSEIFALTSFLRISWLFKLYRKISDLKNIHIAYLFFFLAQILSDFINHSSNSDLIRGSANIAMAMVLSAFLTKLLNNSLDLIIYYFIGEIIRKLIFGSATEGVSLEDMGFLKFRLVPVLNNIILMISWYCIRNKRLTRGSLAILFIGYGLFSIAFDARSNGVSWIVVGAVYQYIYLLKAITVRQLLKNLILFGIAFQSLYALYVSQVLSDGIGGKHAKTQLERLENPYNPINLILTGRAETFVAVQAVADKPLFGHGSWAKDKDGRYTLMLFKMHDESDEKGEAKIEREGNDLIIPSHSVLFGAWMNAGILGFISIMTVFIIALKRGFSLFTKKAVIEGPYFPILVFFLISLTWTFLFSPLSHIKETLPVMIAFIIVFGNKDSHGSLKTDSS